MKLAPLGDKVVLKQVEAQETTKSGHRADKSGEGKATGSNRCCCRPRRRGWRYQD